MIVWGRYPLLDARESQVVPVLSTRANCKNKVRVLMGQILLVGSFLALTATSSVIARPSNGTEKPSSFSDKARRWTVSNALPWKPRAVERNSITNPAGGQLSTSSAIVLLRTAGFGLNTDRLLNNLAWHLMSDFGSLGGTGQQANLAPLQVSTGAKAEQVCGERFSHRLIVRWKVRGGHPPVIVRIEITRPDGRVEVFKNQPRQGKRVFRLSYPGGGSVRVEATGRDSRGSTGSSQSSVSLAPCA